MSLLKGRSRWSDNISLDLKEIVYENVDLISLSCGNPFSGSCGHGNCRKLLYPLSDCQRLKVNLLYKVQVQSFQYAVTI
jgi:hypothetical protein